MSDPAYIQKRQPDPDGLDFDGLRQKGLERLLELSGKKWTDYNLHDPGVTILEVLCYALTDLVYRAEFEVADFLTGQDGLINFEKQALFRPQDIFPSQAVTVDDYRKILFAATPEIDNLWIIPAGHAPETDAPGQVQGLYDISVMPAETVGKPEDIKREIRKCYAANRNLCEDLRQVHIIQPDYYALCGEIEIGGQRNPGDILAEIYFKSAKFLCPGLEAQPFEELLRQGKSLEELLTGPLTAHGYISTAVLDQQREYAQISDLIGIIHGIDGVEFVDTLWFGDGRSYIEYDGTRQSMPRLRLPREENEIHITLKKDGQRVPTPDFLGVQAEYDRWLEEHNAMRRIPQDVAKICDPPHGEHRNFSDYHSIQHHFPEVYGIGKHGVRRLHHKENIASRQARARQFKAFLIIFEQVMANYLANLQALPRLFSLDDRLDRSYFHQLLDNTIVPAVEEIYTHDEHPEIDAWIGKLLRRYDNFSDRRNRILDYLLGIYGEKFSQSSLRRFHPDGAGHVFEMEKISNKITMLREIREISRRRAGAFDYCKKPWDPNNYTSLQKKVSILLGLKNYRNRPLVPDADPQEAEGFHIIEHILLRPLGETSHEPPVPNDFYAFKISVLFPDWMPRFKNDEFRKLAEETVQLNCPAHVLPVFYWLDKERMRKFEEQYQKWLKHKATLASHSLIDESSQALIEFLTTPASNVGTGRSPKGSDHEDGAFDCSAKHKTA